MYARRWGWVAALLVLLASISCAVLVDLSDLQGATDASDEPSLLVVTAVAAPVVQGNQTVVAITVTRPTGNDELVDLTFTSLPLDTTITTVPAVISSGSSSVQVNISTKPTTAQGVFTPRLTASTGSGLSGYVDFTLSVIGPPGSLDTTFGDGGVLSLPYAIDDAALQSDGRFVMCGASLAADGGTDRHVLRLDTSGNIDTTWTELVLKSPKQCITLHAENDDTIAIGDDAGNIYHLSKDGSLDNGFGKSGISHFPTLDAAYAIASLADGTLIVSSAYSHVYRVLPNGTFDATFGDGGVWPGPGTLGIIDIASDDVTAIGISHDSAKSGALVALRSEDASMGEAIADPLANGNYPYALAARDAGWFGLDMHDAGFALVSFEEIGNYFISTATATYFLDSGVEPVSSTFDDKGLILCGAIASLGVAFRVDPSSLAVDPTFGSPPPFASADFLIGSPFRCLRAKNSLVMFGIEDGMFTLRVARFWL